MKIFISILIQSVYEIGNVQVAWHKGQMNLYLSFISNNRKGKTNAEDNNNSNYKNNAN